MRVTRISAASVLLFALLLSLPVALQAQPLVIPLWPQGAPGNWQPPAGEEKIVERGKNGVVDRSIANISQPTLTIYPAPAKLRTGAAVLIAPGGGYGHLAYDKEGLDVAQWLNSLGITGAVLKYRLPATSTDAAARRAALFGDAKQAAQFVRVSLEDAQQAMRLLRERSREWNLDKNRIGMMGFSAGGHLASLLGMQEDASVRPNFLALIYPAIPDPLYVTAQTPPAFLVHASDDSLSADNSIRFYQALRREKVSAELHVYAEGGHGFGLKTSGKTSQEWPKHFAAWFKAMKCPCESE